MGNKKVVEELKTDKEILKVAGTGRNEKKKSKNTKRIYGLRCPNTP